MSSKSDGRRVLCCVINIMSAAVESSLSAALLAPGKVIVVQELMGGRVFEVKQTEYRVIFFGYFLQSWLKLFSACSVFLASRCCLLLLLVAPVC